MRGSLKRSAVSDGSFLFSFLCIEISYAIFIHDAFIYLFVIIIYLASLWHYLWLFITSLVAFFLLFLLFQLFSSHPISVILHWSCVIIASLSHARITSMNRILHNAKIFRVPLTICLRHSFILYLMSHQELQNLYDVSSQNVARFSVHCLVIWLKWFLFGKSSCVFTYLLPACVLDRCICSLHGLLNANRIQQVSSSETFNRRFFISTEKYVILLYTKLLENWLRSTIIMH